LFLLEVLLRVQKRVIQNKQRKGLISFEQSN